MALPLVAHRGSFKEKQIGSNHQEGGWTMNIERYVYLPPHLLDRLRPRSNVYRNGRNRHSLLECKNKKDQF
jgi:hypothetical protein